MFGLNAFGKVGAIVRRAFSGGGFTPASLFASGEQGAWYDPSDLSTMFQDATGTMPVTAVGQPVGLILDKRKAPTSRTVLPVMTCSATVSQAGNVLTFAASPAGEQASGNPPINGNYFYRMSFTIVGTGSVVIYVGAAPVTFSAGTHTLEPWDANAASNFIFRANAGGFNGTVTFTELLEYAGNHATQATASKRPLLQIDGNGKYYLGFDGVDDALATGVASDLQNNVYCFTGTKHTGGTIWVDVWNSNDTPDGYWFVGQSGVGFSPTGASVGSPTYRMNGSDLVAPTRGSVYTAQFGNTTVNSTCNMTFSGNSLNSPLSISGYPQSLFAGNLYSLIMRGATCTAQEITNTETWVNSKTGAY